MVVLVQGAPAYGATERYLGAIASALGERGVLVFPDVPELEPFRLLPVRLEPVPVEPAPLAFVRLARLFGRLKPSVVHINDPFPPAMLAARVTRVPQVVVTHHTPELPRRDNLAGRAWQRLHWALKPEVIYTSETDRRTDSRGNLRTHVVYYGIDLDRFASARPALPGEGRVVGNVARLAPQKGHTFLIQAAPRVLERHADVHFVVVGDGELREELERAAPPGRFLFTGDRPDVPELLASMDVFALPSLYEGLCYAVIEAQAAGVPVVATPVGGVRENVVEGETGVVVPPGDAEALAAGIIRLLDDPQEASRLAAEARRRVRERYSLKRMVDETLAIYGETSS